MEYQGVKLVWNDEKEYYIFKYNGNPNSPLTNHYGEELRLYTYSTDKAKGFVDCLIQLGQI